MGMSKQDAISAILEAPVNEQGAMFAYVDGLAEDVTKAWLIPTSVAKSAMVDFIRVKMQEAADTGRKRCRQTPTGLSTSSGNAVASTGRPSELYCPSINASMLAKSPEAWRGVLAGMKAAGQEFLLEDAAASTALWCSPCLQFWNRLCVTAPAPQDFVDDMATLAVTLRDILLTRYTREDEKQDAIIAALQASGAFPGVVKAKQGEQQPDLRIKDQAFMEVKLAGGSGAAVTQNQVYFLRTIAEPQLLPVHKHCCAPILCIAMRDFVEFSCCARLEGHAVSQELCTWSTSQPAEDLLRMLHAARAFCMEAARTWGDAWQQAAEATAAATGGKPMQAPGSWRNVTRSEGPLPGVLPDWLRGYGAAAKQIGGLSRNVWRLQRAGDAVASASSGQGGADSPSLPNELVVKFLEAAGGKQELALRSWAVHQAWGQAGYAPAVIGKPWLCAGGRYLGYAMEYLPLQQEQGHHPGEGETWLLLQDVLSRRARQLPFLLLEQLSQVALAALQAAHLVEVDWAVVDYDALLPSVVCPRPAVPQPSPAVHGDMRPCNVAVCLEGNGGLRVRFLDFGFAGVAPGLTGNEHAARFPSSLNTTAPIWAYGVKALGIISKNTDTMQLQAALVGFG